MNETKSVAIVILNWNSYELTFDCLKSLENINYPSFEIFLVDNDSQDNSYDKLINDYKNGSFKLTIHFIQSGGNLGFAGGNNVAIKQAYSNKFDYFWMLNNDTEVMPDSLQSLVDEIDKDSTIGIVGSKILYFNTNKIWYAGGTINTWTGKTTHIGYKEEDNGQYNNVKDVEYMTGCSLLFRRELIDAVGLMKEDYFLYYEETDWNIRASKQGWRIRYVPKSLVYHKVSISSGGENNLSPYVEYYYIRNSYVMIRRTQSLLKSIVASLLLIWKLIKGHLKILLKNQNQKKIRSKLIFRAIKDSYLMKTGKLL